MVVAVVVIIVVVVVVVATPFISRTIVSLLLQLCWCHHLRLCLVWLICLWLICLYLRYEDSHLSTGGGAVERMDSAGRGGGRGGMERLTNRA